ncbi:aminopeptidase M1-like protein isoform X1 [Tanacetum coccineum]
MVTRLVKEGTMLQEANISIGKSGVEEMQLAMKLALPVLLRFLNDNFVSHHHYKIYVLKMGQRIYHQRNQEPGKQLNLQNRDFSSNKYNLSLLLQEISRKQQGPYFLELLADISLILADEIQASHIGNMSNGSNSRIAYLNRMVFIADLLDMVEGAEVRRRCITDLLHKVFPSKVVADKDDKTLVLVFDEALGVGDGVSEIKFSGVLNEHMKGFYKGCNLYFKNALIF